MSNYIKCCIECHFHMFNEDYCPNCEAYEIAKECEEEWNRQMNAISSTVGISFDENQFCALWYSYHKKTSDWFKSIVQKVAPEIYDWYSSMDIELDQEEYFEPRQTDLFEPELPF